ncbi:fimbria/pilus outer membrane usher protein [Burkholderia ubonensis]|uniref:fimbria/pilus outer membrane usher protein n=1 Tax=Burkholderia ubonensis TaxID=101571 RepID=UPI00075E9A74|nr:usher protein [Burkholderia ubonensis]
MVRAAKNIALGGVHDVDLSVFRRRRVALAVSLAFGMGLLGDDACAAELDWLDAEQQAGAEPVMHMAAHATTEPAMYMAARATTEPVMHVAARTATDPAVVAFNPRLFAGSGVDLSRFAKGNPVEPGNYAVDVSVNGKGRGRHDVLFRAVPGSDVAMPCFSLAMLKQFGVDGDKVAFRLRQLKPESDDGATAAHEPGPEACLALREAIPDATYTFNSADLKIDLTIPQTAMSKTAQGYVDPSRWDEGINVGLLQYNVNGYTSESNFYGHNFSSLYTGLQSGVNVGPWRFRHRSTLNWASRGQGVSWRSLETFVQRDITALRSQIVLGDSFTSGDIFDSFSVRGVQLSSDDRMLPNSLQAYAPTIRGVADTNARVVVRQGGNTVYEETVSPGPFEFNDLPATGYGGDLEVTVTESDGRVRRFSVPFAAVPQLLRPGRHRFNVTVGQYRDGFSDTKPWVAQLTYQRGITNLVTAYAGVLTSAGYGSGLFGMAFNTSVGAFAFDVTSAHTSVPGRRTYHGVSSRVTYSKMMTSTGTNFSVAAYRYSTSNFFNLQDAVNARKDWNGSIGQYNYRARTRFQVNVNQRLGDRSAIYITGSSQDYWGGERGRDLQYQVGFNSTFRRMSYSVYAQRARNGGDRTVTQVGVNLTIPLGKETSTRSSIFNSLTTSASRDSRGNSAVQMDLSGSKGTIAPFSYGVNASRIVGDADRLSSFGGYGTYRSSVGTYRANASLSNRMRQASFGANGAMIVHRGGVTLSPPLGQAAALIEAKGATGGQIVNGQGASIDRFGFAVIPSLTPYRVNTVEIDPSRLPDDVELGNTSEEVVPRNNSVVFVKMSTVRGRPVFAAMERQDGSPLPMGTQLFDGAGKSIGGVGQGGMAFLRGLEGSGELTAKWGIGAADQCRLPYVVPAVPAGAEKIKMATRVRLRCGTTAMQ